MKISKLIALWGVTSLLTTGCSDDGETAVGEGGETDTETESADDDADGDGATSTDGGDATSGAEGEADSSEDGASFITAGDSDSGEPPPPAPNGGMCNADEECEDENCFVIGGAFGFCSECTEDADCQDEEGIGGCGLDLNVGYAVCQDGSLGSSCEETASCMGELVCAEVIDTGGFFPLDFCSECVTADDCPEPTMEQDPFICSPFLVQDGALSGYRTCAQPEEHENGQLCPLDDAGEGEGAVCSSGYCGVAEVNMGITITIGVCGECVTDEDCVNDMLGDTCSPPTFDLMGGGGITPGSCSGGE